jgi:hypothetical protein
MTRQPPLIPNLHTNAPPLRLRSQCRLLCDSLHAVVFAGPAVVLCTIGTACSTAPHAVAMAAAHAAETTCKQDETAGTQYRGSVTTIVSVTIIAPGAPEIGPKQGDMQKETSGSSFQGRPYKAHPATCNGHSGCLQKQHADHPHLQKSAGSLAPLPAGLRWTGRQGRHVQPAVLRGQWSVVPREPG